MHDDAVKATKKEKKEKKGKNGSKTDKSAKTLAQDKDAKAKKKIARDKKKDAKEKRINYACSAARGDKMLAGRVRQGSDWESTVHLGEYSDCE